MSGKEKFGNAVKQARGGVEQVTGIVIRVRTREGKRDISIGLPAPGGVVRQAKRLLRTGNRLGRLLRLQAELEMEHRAADRRVAELAKTDKGKYNRVGGGLNTVLLEGAITHEGFLRGHLSFAREQANSARETFDKRHVALERLIEQGDRNWLGIIGKFILGRDSQPDAQRGAVPGR